jgi:hypothetical protein
LLGFLQAQLGEMRATKRFSIAKSLAWALVLGLIVLIYSAALLLNGL